MFDDLANHLRKWGLIVIEEPGWQTRGRNFSAGLPWRPDGHVVCHHDASGKSSGNFGSRKMIATGGRPGLPAPLAQFSLGRDGRVVLIAAGRANHGGTGGPRAGMPANKANEFAWGIEAANDGLGEPWPEVQLNSYYRLCAALLAYHGKKDVSLVIAHKEWTPRKPDPRGLNMDKFRVQVAKALEAGPTQKPVDYTKFKIGLRDEIVVRLKNGLAKRGYFKETNRTNYYGVGLRNAVRNFQLAQGWSEKDADGFPGPATLAALGIPYKV